MILLLVWAAKMEVSSLECDGFCILMMGRMRGKIVIVAIQKVEVAVMTDVSAKKQFTMVNCCMVVLKWKIMVTPWSIALPPQIIRFALPKNTFFVSREEVTQSDRATLNLECFFVTVKRFSLLIAIYFSMVIVQKKIT